VLRSFWTRMRLDVRIGVKIAVKEDRCVKLLRKEDNTTNENKPPQRLLLSSGSCWKATIDTELAQRDARSWAPLKRAQRCKQKTIPSKRICKVNCLI